MLRRTLLPTLLLALVAMAGSVCEQERLDVSDGEQACRSLVRCWYPEDGVTSFDATSERWGSMADPKNVQNIRHAYGEDGSCWYVDPMAGTTSDGVEVKDDALAVGCGASCACAILELCFAREDPDPVPVCVDEETEADPCQDPWYPDHYALLCPACDTDSTATPPAYCEGLQE